MADAAEDAWLAEVRLVLGEVLRSDAAEFELEAPGLRLRVRRALPAGAPATVAGTDRSEPETLAAVLAPLAGIFYGSPSPGTRPYVAVGDWVKAGSVVGLIEAMKVFNEVTSEQSGRVARVLVQDGSLVQERDALLLIDPADAPPPSRGSARE